MLFMNEFMNTIQWMVFMNEVNSMIDNISINDSVDALPNLRNVLKFLKLRTRTLFNLLIIAFYSALKSTKSNLPLH